VAHWIADLVQAGGADAQVERVRGEVLALCQRFPVYGS
jgi:glycine/serine hydroxymethyltransferase